LLSVSVLSAQEVKFGAKGGLNISTINVNDTSLAVQEDSKSAIGFHLGGFAEIKLTDKFALQPELLFSLQGAKSEYTETDVETFPGGGVVTGTFENKSTVKTSYINLPILAKFYATEKLFFVAGPQFGFLTSAKGSGESTFTETTTGVGGTTTEVNTITDPTVDIKKNFKGLNVSLGLGGGYFFTENLFAEARYNVGLTNDAKSENDIDLGLVSISTVTAKTNVFQVSVGYRF
jgi:hypothetical protein